MTKTALVRRQRNLPAVVLAFSTLCAACGATPAATTGPVGSRAEGAPEALAVVNGVAIGRAAFDEAARRVASDRRDALTEDEQRRVLDLLIDEELLVQHGLDSGLARDDRRVRAAIVASVMEREKSFPCLGDCTGDELRKFYEDHPDLFRTTARLAVRTLWFSERRPEAALRARQALGELRTGADPDEVAARLADDEIAPPPSAPMPPDKLADYIGAEGAHAAEETPLGAWSDPVAVPGGVRLIFVVSREAGAMRPFAEVEDRIRYEAQQFAAERAVQNLIRDLRAKAKIEVDPDISKGVEK